MLSEQASNTNNQEEPGLGLDPVKIQKIALAIFLKRIPWLFLLFIVIFTSLAYVLWQRTKKRPDRYEATSSLLYTPKAQGNYHAPSTKVLIGLLTRHNLREALATELGLSGYEKTLLRQQIRVDQVRNQPNFVVVTTLGNTADKAMELHQAMLTLGIEEYKKFRVDSLTDSLNYLRKQKEDMLLSVSEYELRLQHLLHPVTLSTPEQQITKLRQIISGQASHSAELSIKIANLKRKIKELTEQLDGFDPNVQAHLETLDYYRNEEERLNRELLRLRQHYTDQNPRVMAAQAELDLILADRQAFVKEYKLEGVNAEMARAMRDMSEQLRKFQSEAAGLVQMKEIAEQESENNKAQSEKLLADLVEENKNKNQIAYLKNTLSKVEDDIPVVTNLLSTIPSELTVMEGAAGAVLTDKSMLKKMVIAIFLAAIVVFNVAAAWGALLFISGRLESYGEMGLTMNVESIGEFPALKNANIPEERLNEIVHDLCLQLKGMLPDGSVLFAVGLEGSTDCPTLRELFHTNFAMYGLRQLHLICDSAKERERIAENGNSSLPLSPWTEDLLAVELLNDGQAFFCLSAPNLLLASELEILTRDLAILKEHYDLIVIRRQVPFNGSELLLRQLSNLATATMFIAGLNSTPRQVLRNVAKVRGNLSAKACSILTGAKNS